MKKLISIICIAALLVTLLAACTKKEERPRFRGTVEEMRENQILLAETENPRNLIRFDVSGISDKESKDILKNLREGDSVTVIFDGVICESYPGQATAEALRRCDE